MAILKTEIFGSNIEINYEESEYNQLIKLINIFKRRLEKIPNDGRINNLSRIFLLALKTEDQLEDFKKLIDGYRLKINKDKITINNKLLAEKELKNKIIDLIDEINDLKLKNISHSNNNLKLISEIDILEKEINNVKTKIKKFIYNE